MRKTSARAKSSQPKERVHNNSKTTQRNGSTKTKSQPLVAVASGDEDREGDVQNTLSDTEAGEVQVKKKMCGQRDKD